MFLPIVHRELLVASRKRATFWFRLLPPALAFLVAGLFFVFASVTPVFPAGNGHPLFVGLSYLLLIYALLAGVIFTSDSISEERREGTLALLQLTGLSGHNIVLGKLASHSLAAIFNLAAVLPALTLPILIGGVTGLEVARVVLLIVPTLFLSLAISLFTSSQSTTQEQSLRTNIILLLLSFFLGLFSFVYFFWNQPAQTSDKAPRHKAQIFAYVFFLAALTFLLIFQSLPGSIVYLFAKALKTSGFPLDFTLSVLSIPVLAVGFILAAAGFSKSQTVEIPTVLPNRETAPALPLGPAPSSQASKRPFPLRHKHPIYWLISPPLTNRRPLLLLAALSIGCAIIRLFGVGNFLDALYWFIWLPSLLLTFLISKHLAGFFSDSRSNGMLETVLVTPVRWREILDAHLQLFANVAAVPLLLIMVAGLISGLNGLGGPQEIRPVSVLLYLLEWVAWLYALFWFSLFFALKRGNALHAAGLSLLAVDLAPTLLGWIVSMILFRFAGPSLVGMVYNYALHLAVAFTLYFSGRWAEARVTRFSLRIL